jgi:hypothetical protein
MQLRIKNNIKRFDFIYFLVEFFVCSLCFLDLSQTTCYRNCFSVIETIQPSSASNKQSVEVQSCARGTLPYFCVHFKLEGNIAIFNNYRLCLDWD